jgi:Escherichia/Staphylococcus phage prohead protease
MRELRSALIRDAGVKSGRTVHGLAAVYDTPWNEALIQATGYVEIVARGAFRKALARSENVPLLWQHDRDSMLATTRGKTLRLKEDGRGVAFEADMPNTQLGNDLLEHIRRGDVQGMSFGAKTSIADSSIKRIDGLWHRTINNFDQILDVTLTYEPAYEAATVELRSKGFVALPLQELIGGAEAQTDEAAAEGSSLETDEHFERLRRRIDRLATWT